MSPGRKKVSEDKRFSVADRDEWRCVYCDRKVYDDNRDGKSLNIDHRRPVSKGGSNRKRNLQATCARCNKEKGDKTHKQYMRWLKQEGLLKKKKKDNNFWSF